MALTKAEARARSRAFVDASDELTAWMEAKLALLDGDTRTDEELAAGRLLIFKDLGRRAERSLDQITRDHR